MAPSWPQVVEFYKAWDRYGALSNFSPHAIRMPPGPYGWRLPPPPQDPSWLLWPTVEHYYQVPSPNFSKYPL